MIKFREAWAQPARTKLFALKVSIRDASCVATLPADSRSSHCEHDLLSIWRDNLNEANRALRTFHLRSNKMG
jgi:hypothetical protein